MLGWDAWDIWKRCFISTFRSAEHVHYWIRLAKTECFENALQTGGILKRWLSPVKCRQNTFWKRRKVRKRWHFDNHVIPRPSFPQTQIYPKWPVKDERPWERGCGDWPVIDGCSVNGKHSMRYHGVTSVLFKFPRRIVDGAWSQVQCHDFTLITSEKHESDDEIWLPYRGICARANLRMEKFYWIKTRFFQGSMAKQFRTLLFRPSIRNTAEIQCRKILLRGSTEK